jgi:hypothetical protein
MNASPNPCGRLPAAHPNHRPRRPARTNSRLAANATGGTGNDQFAVERLGADCRRLWLSRHATTAVRVPDAVQRHSASLRAFTPVFDGLRTRVKRAYGVAPPIRDRRGFFVARAIRNPPDESRKYREKQEERPLANQRT